MKRFSTIFFPSENTKSVWCKSLLNLTVIMTYSKGERSEPQISETFGCKSRWGFWGSVSDFVKNWGTTLQQKPFELWAYSKAHLIYESALMKQTELWLNLMKSGAVSLWFRLIWHSNHFSPLSFFPGSLVCNVDLVRKAALKSSRCYYFLHCYMPNIGTKHFRSRNLHSNWLSELHLCWSFLVASTPTLASCLALVRFGVKTCWDLLWYETEIYLF